MITSSSLPSATSQLGQETETEAGLTITDLPRLTDSRHTSLHLEQEALAHRILRRPRLVLCPIDRREEA